MSSIRVGVVGIGNIGFAHANSIANGEISGLKLIAVCDIDETKTTSFSEKHKEIQMFSDYEKMLSADILDAIVIAVPHPLHSDFAIKALEKGIHVLLEKPVDISASRVIKLNEVAEKSGKVFAIMFNQRTNPLFQKAREIVKSGQLGDLKRTVWIITNWFRTQEYYDCGNWRATWSGEGGGVLLNQAPHNLDIWQWICGMPESVTAFCDVGKYHKIEVEDDATIFTRYNNGATGAFMISTGEYPGTNRLEISGSCGKMVLENGQLKWWRLKRDLDTVIKSEKQSFAAVEYECKEFKQDHPDPSHKGILQNFANAVLYGEELLSPGYEGLNELIISNAAYYSQWNNNMEVKLPLDQVLFDRELNSKMQLSENVCHKTNSDTSASYKKRWQVNW